MNSFAYLVDMVAFFLLWYELTNCPYTSIQSSTSIIPSSN